MKDKKTCRRRDGEKGMKNERIFTNVPNANTLITAQGSCGRRNVFLCDLHYHDEVELLSITYGALDLFVNGRRHPCREGDLVFLSSRIPHATFVTDKGCTYTLVQFRPEHYLEDSQNAGKYFSRFVRNAVEPFRIFENQELSALVAKALAEYERKEEAFALYIKGAIHAMIALLCREGLLSTKSGVHSADIEKIRPALLYIEEHFAKDISLEEISAVQNLNPSYFCRIFKRASGSGFIDYLNFVRVCKSEKLLAAGTKSILDVSYDVGFSSVSYFNRIFKKYKNCTPTEYRKAQYENH